MRGRSIATRSRLCQLHSRPTITHPVGSNACAALSHVSASRQTIATSGTQHHGSYFSTLPSDEFAQDSAPSIDPLHEKELDNLLNEIRFHAKAGDGHQADQSLKSYLLKSKKYARKLTQEELQTGYNLVLQAWSNSNHINSAIRASQLLKSMPVQPTQLSYLHMLKCFSRVKKTHKQYASQQAETILRKLQSMGLEDLWSAYHLTLKACSKTGDADRAARLLQEMAQQVRPHTDTQPRTYVSKYIVSTVLMALKKRPQQAENLLDNLHENLGLRPDLVHYCTVLNAWAAAKNGPRCEALWNKMQAKGIKSNIAVMRHILQAWRGNLDRQEQLFRAMVHDYTTCPYRNHNHTNNPGGTDAVGPAPAPAVQPDAECLSIVLSAQAQGEQPDRAEALLHWIVTDPDIQTFLQPNVVCFTNVIHAWAKAQQPQRAEALLRYILEFGQEPNLITYSTVIHAWASVGNVERARALWEEMIQQQNIGPNHYTLNSLVLAYANAKKPEEAQQVLEEVSEAFGLTPDLATYATILRAWSNANQPHKARELLDQLRQREEDENVVLLDIVSYNTVIQAYALAGMAEEADQLLSEMLENDNNKRNSVRPDTTSFTQVLSAYTKSKDPKFRQQSGQRAELLLQQMRMAGREPNTVAFNAFLNGFAVSGRPEAAEAILKSMIRAEGVQADTITLNSCLNAWARSGNAEQAEKLLFEIVSDPRATQYDNRVRPDVQSFSTVMSAWAKQGSVETAEHAENILRHMSHMERRCKPDTVAYNTVLQAWLIAASRTKDPNVAVACAQRADRLFLEMKELHEVKAVKDVRPDRITYNVIIRVWMIARNNERSKVLEKEARSLGLL